ncbi:MAG: hypothetical protein K2O67_06135, partial [Clostridia bacterium]|nr:hypothetical protein [Clostridia bacterium]
FTLLKEGETWEPTDTDKYTPDIDGITEEMGNGLYVYNFMIIIPNHDTVYGKLHVDVKHADGYLFMDITDDTIEDVYGYEVSDDLAKFLFENGYAEYNRDIGLGTKVSYETFIDCISVKIVDANSDINGDAYTGKLPVGEYKVYFYLNWKADASYNLYHSDQLFVNLTIKNYVLDIDWGDEDNLNYEYDGEKHMPVITVKDGDGNPVTLQVGENVITINGEQVKIKVTVPVNDDFTTVGGHSVLITVDDQNYVIEEEDALRSVTITGKTPAPVDGIVVDEWQLWVVLIALAVLLLILIILVIVLVKRKKVTDEDGFYDPVDESELQ